MLANRTLALGLVTLAACGPFSTGDVPEATDTGASASPAADGGTVSTDPGDAGTAGGAAGAQDLVAHDLHVTGFSASTIFAHHVHAHDIRCGQVVMVTDAELPKPGRQNIHGDVVVANEAHVHDIDAQWVQADVLYAVSIDSR